MACVHVMSLEWLSSVCLGISDGLLPRLPSALVRLGMRGSRTCWGLDWVLTVLAEGLEMMKIEQMYVIR